MSDTGSIGPRGENEASDYLQGKGYKILHRNWKSGKKEIDVVARDGTTVVFVEVKTRSDDYLVHPRGAVTTQKQKMIIFAAEDYIKRYNIDSECRFDIVSVITRGQITEIEHIENAFYPTLR
ncbi:MAG: YraN family protein [Bacteroidales bacterium]